MPSESFVTFSEMQIIAYCCKKNQVIGLISTHLVFGHKKECSVAQSFIHVENILWNNHQRSNCAKSLFSGFRLLYFKRRSIEKIIKECAAELSASSLCVIQGLLPGGWMPITPTVCLGCQLQAQQHTQRIDYETTGDQPSLALTHLFTLTLHSGQIAFSLQILAFINVVEHNN